MYDKLVILFNEKPVLNKIFNDQFDNHLLGEPLLVSLKIFKSSHVIEYMYTKIVNHIYAMIKSVYEF